MMRSPMLGEFMGTFAMMVLGNGVVAGCLLRRSKVEGSGWIAISIAWGLAVFCGIFVSNLFGSPDAHLNPAITLAFAVQRGSFAHLLPFVVAQMTGAFLGAIVVWLFYYPHWAVTEDPAVKLGVFCTSPAIRAYAWNLLSEIVATFLLVIILGAISSHLVLSTGAVAGLSPFLVGCVVTAIGLCLGGTTGYAINPARDFAPRCAHAILPIAGKGGSDWGYAWIPVVGPCIGGCCAGLLLRAVGA